MPQTCSVTTTIRDTFAGVAQTPLISHAPEIGGAWANTSGTGLQTQSGKTFNTTAGVTICTNATAITGTNKVARGAIVNVNGSNNGVDSCYVGVVNSSNSGYYWGADGNNIVLKKSVNGVLSTLYTTSFTFWANVRWDFTLHITYNGANPTLTCMLFDSVSTTIIDSTSPIAGVDRLSIYANGLHTVADGFQLGFINGMDGVDLVGIIGDATGANILVGDGNDITYQLDKSYLGTAIITNAAAGNSTLGNARLNHLPVVNGKLAAFFSKRKLLVLGGMFDVINSADQANAGLAAYNELVNISSTAKAQTIPWNEIWAYQVPDAKGPTNTGSQYFGKVGANFLTGKNNYNQRISTASASVLTGSIPVPSSLISVTTANYILGGDGELFYPNAAGVIAIASAVAARALTCVTTGGGGGFTQQDIDLAVANAIASARQGYFSQAQLDIAVANATTTARQGYVTQAVANTKYQDGYTAGKTTVAAGTNLTDIVLQLKNANEAGYQLGFQEGKIRRRR